jgi:hypothetical protein
LPLDVCQRFEQIFGLQYDKVNDIYIVDDTLRSSLVANNASVNFTLGNGTASVVIDFPYSFLDFTLGPPYINTTSRVFPLRRAANASLVTLGRVFLQRIYLTANYDTDILSISRAVYDADTAPRVLAITNSTSSPPPPRDKNLNSGSIAGIVIGSVAAVLAVLGLIYIWFRKRHVGNEKQANNHILKAELDSKEKPRAELNAEDTAKFELGAIDGGELEGSTITPIELPGSIPQFELRDRQRD